MKIAKLIDKIRLPSSSSPHSSCLFSPHSPPSDPHHVILMFIFLLFFCPLLLSDADQE